MNILFDIGKTKMRLAGFSGGDAFSEPVIVDTPDSFDEFVELFSKIIKDISGDSKIESIVGGVGAPISKDKTIVLGSRLAGPLKYIMEKKFAVPFYMENDANMVGLGEAIYGAGKDKKIVAYMTVSTGVGGARIIDKKIDQSSAGFQPGQDIIDFDKSSFDGYGDGTLQSLISGRNTEARLGMKPYEVAQGNCLWGELALTLSYGINNVIVYWRPDVVVLGGSMIVGYPAISVSRTAQYLKKELRVSFEVPEIKKAELGDIGGLYGAMAYLRQI